MTPEPLGIERRILRARDGAQLALDVCGRGPALLLVHGTSADGSRWHPLMRRFSSQFTCLALHRRGRAGSEDGTSPHDVELEADDIVVVAGAAPPPLLILAHSFGALCALHAAPALPGLAGLALYEPPVSREPRPLPPVLTELEALIAAGEAERALVAFFANHVGLPPAAIARLRGAPSWPSRVASVHTITRELRAACHYRLEPERLSRLRLPVLMLQGSESPLPLLAASAMLERVLPHARALTLQRQGHFAMDGDLEQFASAVGDFLIESAQRALRSEGWTPSGLAAQRGSAR